MDQARDPESLRYWLALLRTPGVGPRTYAELLNRWQDPEAFFAAGATAWRETLPEAARQYLNEPDWAAVDTDLAWLQVPNSHLLTLRDAAYPDLLHQLPDPPPVLYVRGDPQVLARPQLAIVGSRHATATGAETATEFAHQLAAAGLTITSGLAIGIDGAAHRGALDADGLTLAVAATGLDRVYPARHRELAHAIAEQGALVSEFPIGASPRSAHFPHRNRLISGLSLGTLVVEAAPHSGSLITARLAAEQGREVLAIPGSIHNPLARGCHALIRQGAKLVETAQDVLEELGPQIAGPQPPSAPLAKAASWSEEEAQVLAAVGFEPTGVDRIVERTGLTPETVSSMLLVLELHGAVSAVSGGFYMRSAKSGL